MYDVVIIGAGISGLVCGCYLAKAGMKVLIVEQHNKPGGYFTSFKRSGFLFDAAAHSFGNYREGGHVRKILTELGVDKIVKIQRFDPSDVVVAPDFRITFWNDKEKTIADLIKVFPQEEINIVNFFDFVTTANQFEFAKLKDKTFSGLLRSFFKDEKLISSLALPVFVSGGLPPSLMGAFIGLKIFSEFILDGGYYPQGGIQSLPDALVCILKQNNGEILHSRLVKKIILKDNTAVGIKLDNNESFFSKYVVSACDLVQTYKSLLDEKVVERNFIQKLASLTPSISTFILYLGIKDVTEEFPLPNINMGYMPSYDLDKIYSYEKDGNLSKSNMFLLRLLPDQKTIVSFFHAPFKTQTFWKKNKKSVIALFINKIEEIIPNIKKYIVCSDAATPYTLFRYTHNYKGAAFGWAKTPSQAFDLVMAKTSSFNGLYFTGHWTGTAYGMPGICYSGYDTAKRILKKEMTMNEVLIKPLHSGDKLTTI